MLGPPRYAPLFLLAKNWAAAWEAFFAAFPAVFVSAILSCAIDGGTAADISSRPFVIARGALIGMTVNIFAPHWPVSLITRYGWRRGIVLALCGWLAAAALILGGASALGWLAS